MRRFTLRLSGGSMSLQRMSRVIVGCLAAVAVIFATMATFTYWSTRQSHAAWSDFQTNNNQVGVLHRGLVQSLGYGAFIHEFKNFVLRGGDERLARVQQHGGAILTKLDQVTYLSDGETDAAMAAHIAAIRNVVLNYVEQAGAVRQYHSLGFPPEKIDETVKVDDGPAIAGITALMGETMALMDLGAQTGKGEILVALRRTLGYGGLIHQFKNYVLRKDAPRYDKIQSLIADIRALLQSYEAMQLTPAEQTAIATLNDLMDTIDTAADDVRRMTATGADARQIDQTVKWDDSPAIAALNTLEQAILQKSRADAQLLSSKLSTNERLALATIAGILIVMGLLGSAFYRTLWNSAVRPAQAISDAILQLAGGNTDIDVSAYAADTEIGRIADSCAAFRSTLETNAEMSERAQQDAQLQRDQAEATAQLMKEQKLLQTEVAEKVGMIQREVNSIKDASWQLSSRTEQQAKTLESSASALESLTSSVGSVADSASTARHEMEEVVGVTKECKSIVAEAIGGMEKVVASSDEISRVTELIDQISFQTNLLALNAGVEAARAGDAGRGFAVVATEVRALAGKSADAALEIKQMLDTNKLEISTGADSVSRAGDSIGKIATLVERALGIVDNVANSAQEQSDGLRDLNGSVKELDSVTHSNAAMFEETAASTAVLSENVEELIAVNARIADEHSEHSEHGAPKSDGISKAA